MDIINVIQIYLYSILIRMNIIVYIPFECTSIE